MAEQRGRCTNTKSCPIADSGREVRLPAGGNPVCPYCGKGLTVGGGWAGPSSRGFITRLALGALAVAMLIIVVIWVLHDREPAPPTAASPILRLHGSNTIGSELAVSLAEEFLSRLGARDIRLVETKQADEKRVQGILPGERLGSFIEIQAHGSGTAFKDLNANKCVIGMASRPITPQEAADLSKFGDMTGPASEHVLGLDGIAVIIHKNNPVDHLTVSDLQAIFTGDTKDWSDVPGASGMAGQINVYARDDKSGTYDMFKSLVLKDRALISSATRFEDSASLSDSVSRDPDGIGFIGLPYVRSAKAVALSENGVAPLLPNRLTVGTESYALTRRLFLYTPSSNLNNYTGRFLEFALNAGQPVVEKAGFIGLTPIVEPAAGAANSVPEGAPQQMKNMTAGLVRLPLDFRFRRGSAALDNRALDDLGRVAQFASDMHLGRRDLLLLGFADSTGSELVSLKLSRDRAKAVAGQLSTRGVDGVETQGFGSAVPVAANDSEEGRSKNRRVEVWVRK